MSYEGYVQRICEKGHYSTADAFEEYGYVPGYEEEDLPRCHCGAKIVWRNSVNETNCEGFGYIDMAPFLIKEAQTSTCAHCGHTSIVSKEKYRVPTEDETKAAQTYRREDGKVVLLSEYPV